VALTDSHYSQRGSEATQRRGRDLQHQQPVDAAEDGVWRKGSIVLNSQQKNKQQVKLKQGKYSYTKRKKHIIDSKRGEATGPSARGSADYRPAPSRREFVVIARRRMEPGHRDELCYPLPFPACWVRESSNPRPSLLRAREWGGYSAAPSRPRKA